MKSGKKYFEYIKNLIFFIVLYNIEHYLRKRGSIMIKITKEFKENLSKQETQENITKFLIKILQNTKDFSDLKYQVKNNKLTLYCSEEIEKAEKIIYSAVSETKEISETKYNLIKNKFTAELYFKEKIFTDKETINYLYQETVKATKEKLKFKFIDKIETDRKKYLYNILKNCYHDKSKIEKIIKENLKADQFNYIIDTDKGYFFKDNLEFNINFENFEIKVAEYNKKAEKYNKNLIENYIKETDPDLYFAKFSKETKKETVKKAETVKAEEIKEEIKAEDYYFSMNFHELNKFIKAGSDFMKLSAELRFQLYNYRQFLYEKTYR